MNERDVFAAALEIADSVARAAYLDRTCRGDTALRQRIELLLRTHSSAGDFMQRPAVEQFAAGTPVPQDVTLPLAASDGPEPAASLGFLQLSSRPGSLGRLAQYEILEVIGQGGFGIVLKAFDEKLHRMAAVKVLSDQLAGSAIARKRFVREARAAAAVNNQHVVGIYAVDEEPVPYLVMEYIGGETLQQKLDRSGPLELKEVLRIGSQIADGLAAAHRQGLIHRDIKPGNILLENGVERVKITDFGLARAADDASLSQSGMIAGTPMYMAPEQAQVEHVDQRADLFSLGSVLYTMCAGQPPFRASSTLAILKRVCEATPRPLREVNPEVPRWLCDLISRLHAKKPEDRFGSAREVADLLARHLAELQQRGSGQTRAAATATVSPRRRWAMAATVLVLLGFAGLGLSEATNVTNVRGTVIRLFSPDGTLVVEVDDPGVSVAIDGEEMVITGAGVKEIRLKPGQYHVKASKDGKVLSQELVTVSKNGRQVVRVSREASSDTAAWEKSVALLPADEQVKAVVTRLKERNPEFEARVLPRIDAGHVTELELIGSGIRDLSPTRALPALRALRCVGDGSPGVVAPDLSLIKGMRLEELSVRGTPVTDLTPLVGMPLAGLELTVTQVTDLSPLSRMPLKGLHVAYSPIQDLTPLKGLKLDALNCDGSRVTDLSPIAGQPIRTLNLRRTQVSDLGPVKGMPLEYIDYAESRVTDISALKDAPLKRVNCDFRPARDAAILRSIRSLEEINGKPAAQFWREVDGK